MATPKQFRRRGRWSLIVGALLAALTFGAVMAFASGSDVGTTVNWDKNGTNADGSCKTFLDDSDLNPAPGQQGWLFILTQPASGATYQLTTSFTPSFQTPSNPIDPFTTGGSIHFVVYTTAGATLNSASATGGTANSNLTVSHCVASEKAKPEISTKASTDGDPETGDTFKDTATLSGGTTSPAISGTITFRLYNLDDDSDCSGTPIYTEDVTTVNGNGDYTTATGFPIVTKGTYTWTAEYLGDDNNEGAGPEGCGDDSETLDFKADAPDIQTQIHLGPSAGEGTPTVVGGAVHVALGSTVHDSATATGGPSTPEGTVDFLFYSTIDCTDTGVDAGSDVGLDSNGVAHPSDDEAALAPGSYGFKAFYTSTNADKWKDSEGICEPLTVDKGDLAIVTKIHNASHGEVGGDTHVALGSVVHDTAHVTGQVTGFDPDLTKVGFAFYTSIDCTGDGSLAGNTGPDNSPTNLDPRSGDTQPLAAGSYSFQARFAGDANYNPVKGSDVACEPLTVDKGTLSILTKIHDSSHAVVTFVPVNGIVHDTAHVTGQVTGFDPDLTKVGFAFYTTIDCTGDGSLAGNTGFDEVTTSDVRSADTGQLASGAYSFRARFAGDANYNAVPGSSVACEPLSVRTFGKTMGFWGNPNGIARIIAAGGYYANAVAIGRGSNVDTQAEATKILPNNSNLNACGKGSPSIFTVGAATATQNCTLASGVNINSLNTLAAQTLALGYNIKLVSGFTGQPLSALGCAPVNGLTGASTVNDAFNKAVALINGSASGGTTTQTQIGLMNTLLGCINAEA